jgi:DNA-binding NarL/FixJ family response regulator
MTEQLTTTEFNALTGETIIRPLTAEELAEREAMQAAQEALQAEQEAKIAARQSALAKLAALGLTEEEIGAL